MFLFWLSLRRRKRNQGLNLAKEFIFYLYGQSIDCFVKVPNNVPVLSGFFSQLYVFPSDCATILDTYIHLIRALCFASLDRWYLVTCIVLQPHSLVWQ